MRLHQGEGQGEGGQGGGGVRLAPEGGQGAEAEEGDRLDSRRGWREDSSYLPKGWMMAMGGWRKDASFLPIGRRRGMGGWRESASFNRKDRRFPTGWKVGGGK